MTAPADPTKGRKVVGDDFLRQVWHLLREAEKASNVATQQPDWHIHLHNAAEAVREAWKREAGRQ